MSSLVHNIQLLAVIATCVFGCINSKCAQAEERMAAGEKPQQSESYGSLERHDQYFGKKTCYPPQFQWTTDSLVKSYLKREKHPFLYQNLVAKSANTAENGASSLQCSSVEIFLTPVTQVPNKQCTSFTPSLIQTEKEFGVHIKPIIQQQSNQFDSSVSNSNCFATGWLYGSLFHFKTKSLCSMMGKRYVVPQKRSMSY